jgi:hypothetical protein
MSTSADTDKPVAEALPNAATQNKRGIFLAHPAARWIWMGKKTSIIKDKENPDIVDSTLYLVDKEFCYGIIRMHPPNKINLEQFKERERFHLINEENRKSMFCDKNEFHEYSFEWINHLSVPLMWKSSDTLSEIVENVELLENEDEVEKMFDDVHFKSIEAEKKIIEPAFTIDKCELKLTSDDIKGKEEGRISNIDNIPLRMQMNLNKIRNNKLWMPFVMQMHYATDGTMHKDLRLFIPNRDYGKILIYNNAKASYLKNELGGILEGFKIDLIESPNNNIKIAQPMEWLFFEGENDGTFITLNHGIYTVNYAGKDKILLELKSDDEEINKGLIETLQQKGIQTLPAVESFNGEFVLEFDKGGLFFEKAKTRGRDSDIKAIHLYQVYHLKESHNVREICDMIGLSRMTVYKCFELLGI